MTSYTVRFKPRRQKIMEINILNAQDEAIYHQLQEPYNRLYLLSSFGDPLLVYMDTAFVKLRGEAGFQNSLLWRTLLAYHKLYNMSLTCLNGHAFEMAVCNIFYIYNLYNLKIGESMGLTSLLFDDVKSEIYTFNESNNNFTKHPSSSLRQEFIDILDGNTPHEIETRHFFAYLGHVLYRWVQQIDDVYYNFNLENPSDQLVAPSV